MSANAAPASVPASVAASVLASVPLRRWDALGADDWRGRAVVVRVDFNLPQNAGADGGAGLERLHAALPGLLRLAATGARLVLLSHAGRPRGIETISLSPVAEAWRNLLPAETPFAFCDSVVGEAAEAAVAAVPQGGMVLLENLRHEAGETACEPDFVAALARLGTLYVNDAFSVAHRAHASVSGLPRKLPGYAGPLLLAELDALTDLIRAPDAAAGLAIVGGAKISTKQSLLWSLAERFAVVAPAGGIANGLLAAGGLALGDSLVEEGESATAFLAASQRGELRARLVLPVDLVLDDGSVVAVEDLALTGGVPAGRRVLDLGPRSVEACAAHARASRLVVWNGPLGLFETPPFDAGTRALAQALAAARASATSRTAPPIVVAGGGETCAAIAAAGVGAEAFSFLSTAGGAFLAWLEGRALPGIEALRYPPEAGGPKGAEPTRFGDWERNGMAVDF